MGMSADPPTPVPSFRPSVALLGADAGGSHSTVVIGLADGRLLGRAEGPGASMKPGNATASAVVLAETARRAAAQAALALPVDRAVVGAAGAGRAQEQAELESALRDVGLARRVRVLADAEVALSAAFGRGPGVLVNAGTGSIAYARDPHGGLHRAGGYGWQLGDEGGGYWLGRRALEAAAWAQGGRGEGATPLARPLAGPGLPHFDEPGRRAPPAPPAPVGAPAPHVLNAAREGEAVAQRAPGDAARGLGALVAALEQHFPRSPPPPPAVPRG